MRTIEIVSSRVCDVASVPDPPPPLDITESIDVVADVMPGSLACECGAGPLDALAPEVARRAAVGGSTRCTRGHVKRAWLALRHVLERVVHLWPPILLAPGGHVTIQLPVPVHRYFELSFGNLGLPEGATAHRCITMSLAAERPVALVHETGQMIGSPGLRDPLAFYAYPLVPPSTVAEWTHAKVQIHTTWAPPPTDLEAHDLLVAGLLAYGDEDFNAAVLHLHTALDVMSAHRAESFLPRLGLPSRARSVLTLPERLAFIQLHADSALTEQALASIRVLNRLRNDRVAHNGRLLTVTDAVEPVCGAVAVLWWLYLLPPVLPEAPVRTDR